MIGVPPYTFQVQNQNLKKKDFHLNLQVGHSHDIQHLNKNNVFGDHKYYFGHQYGNNQTIIQGNLKPLSYLEERN